ncbi:MAG: substrate-binding domain-containing protein [bacterium]|nr:substrate-binding domain-containing protein [bacterium]MCY3653318.1 substrate-binding domain-containing protein [bacterium]
MRKNPQIPHPPPAGVTETVTPSDPVDTTQADTPSDETPSDPVATTQAGGPSPADPVAPVTRGPGGEVATPSGEVVLSDGEVAEVRSGGFTAALLWHTAGAFTDAVSQGARDAFADLGVEVIAETNAQFDAAQQANDVETVMAQNPDIIVSLVIDPVSGAEAFRPAVDADVQLVFLSNVPEGYVQGQDYVGIVTDDLAAMGIAAADLLADALDGEGKVGFIFHDAAYYVTNQRDQAFKAWIEAAYPNIEIVEEQGLADPAAAEEIASSLLTRNPDLDGIYAPWSAGPADGVLAALRAAGASDVAVVTLDLDTNVSLDLVEGGNIVGIAADEAYDLGRTMALKGAYGLLNKPAPAFTVVPAIAVTANNIVEAYRQSLATDPPPEVLQALGELPVAPVTRGPGGEVATPSGEVVLSDGEVAEVRSGGFTAALLWHTAGAFTDAVSQGARDAFADLGVEVIAETNAQFDAAQQANDVETVMAQNPDIIVSLVIDPVSGAEAFRPAVDADVQLVFLSNVPEGYVQGQDYVGIVTDDLAAMGIAAADLLADALDGEGKVGFIFHDAAYYVTNQRDQAFKAWIEAAYPNIEIVEEQGLADPAAAEEIASSLLTRNPDLDGIYAPWSAGPADGVLAALRAAGASDVAVVTLDLDTNVSLDLVEGGNIVGIAADEAYDLGRTMALKGAYGLLNKPAPAFTVVPAIAVTANNIVEAYRQSLATDPPPEVLQALGG